MKKLKKLAATALAVVLCATSIMCVEPKTAKADTYCNNHVIYYAGVRDQTTYPQCLSYHYKFTLLGWKKVDGKPNCYIDWKVKSYRCYRCDLYYEVWTKVKDSHPHYVYW